MSNPCYESIATYNVGHFKIRVWRAEEAIGDLHQADLEAWTHGANERMMFDNQFKPTIKELLETLVEFPNVAAVEVTDERYASGCLVYVNWP